MFQVYVLLSVKDLRTYIGYSSNSEERLKEHNAGKVNATKNRRPFKIIKVENCKTELEAKQRERYWKSGSGRRKLKRLFKEGFPPVA